MKDSERIKPMTEAEIESFRQSVREKMKGDRLSLLELNLKINSKLKQQYEIRIEVIKELINGKARTDYKTKQFHDEDN